MSFQEIKSKKPKSEHLVNNEIPFKKVYVIDENKEKIGVLNTKEAVDIAREKGMDLILISVSKDEVTGEPRPIARFLDYGRFKYDRKKKQKELKEKQTVIENREIRLTVNIGDNDLKVKANKAREFLLKGDHLKVSLKFKGRERGRSELGFETINKFVALIEDISIISKPAALNAGKFLDIYFQPSKKKAVKNTTDVKGDQDGKDKDEN